eukprot:Skav216772  [mRNA]  locus=scaffold3378:52640:56882:- [translate_table: standard]
MVLAMPNPPLEQENDMEAKRGIQRCVPFEVPSVVAALQLDEDEGPASVRLERLRTKNYLEVDVEIARGIPLAKTLRKNGWLWKVSPIDMKDEERQNLWGSSRPVQSFDLFVSHTWHTRGSLKVLSLLLQFGWRYVIIIWFLAVVLMVILGAFRVLPMPISLKQELLDFEAECPAGPWLSPSYLSRLWCVFELAAYRKANPSGLITVRPLFIEQQFFGFILAAAFATAIVFGIFASRAGLGSSISLTLLAFSPMFFIVHSNRKLMTEKHLTISALKTFNLVNLQCRLDKDRVFILTAISDWYGSEEAFTDYVRGPLYEEVVAAATNRLPFHYALMTVLIPYSLSLDVLTAQLRAGAPLEVLLSEAIGSGFGWVLLWQLVALKLLWVLCDRLAAPRICCVLDWAVSLSIFLMYYICVLLGSVISDMLYQTNMWGGFAFAGCACLLVWFLYRN